MTMEHLDRQLRYFVKIAQRGSLSRAAEALNLTQSGISHQLALLEEQVGQPLFRRTGRGVELNSAGELLFAAAKPAYNSIDEALKVVREKEGLTQGLVRLAVVHTLSYYFTSAVVTEFFQQREKVNLSLMGRSSPEVVALVENGRADIGFVYDSAVDSANLVPTPLFEEEMCVIARFDSDLPDRLDLTAEQYRMIGFPTNYALRRMLHAGGLHPKIVAEADTVEAMLGLVSSGIGICVLPSLIPDPLLVDYGLKKWRIVKPLLSRRVVIVVRKETRLPTLVKDLIEIALTSTRQDLSKLKSGRFDQDLSQRL